MFERHRPALRRQAARLLYASGHDSDDVLQDVFLRVHTALRGGVVPLEPRAWLLRLVHNACVDELRRGRTRASATSSSTACPRRRRSFPTSSRGRAEARALLGDIHRLPERQRHVLVMSALDGLSHEEVAGRLDTTVETTRSLLARARENLRRTAAARETAVPVGLRRARRGRRRRACARARSPAAICGSCADCRAYQRDLRAAPAPPAPAREPGARGAWSRSCSAAAAPRRVQKVAVGTCCALVGVGGAVAVPEIAVHSQRPAGDRRVGPGARRARARACGRSARARGRPRRLRPPRPRPPRRSPRSPARPSEARAAAETKRKRAAKPRRRVGPRGEPHARRAAGACARSMRTFLQQQPDRGRAQRDVRAAARSSSTSAAGSRARTGHA